MSITIHAVKKRMLHIHTCMHVYIHTHYTQTCIYAHTCTTCPHAYTHTTHAQKTLYTYIH